MPRMSRKRDAGAAFALGLAAALLCMPWEAAQAVHPKLFFYGGDISALRQKAQTTHNEIVQYIWAYADQTITENQDTPVQAYFCDPANDDWRTDSQFNQAGGNVTIYAFAHASTGDARYRDLAKAYLLAYAGWPTWNGGPGCNTRDLGLAHMVTGNALAYDWLYADLTDAERTTARSALAKHAQELYDAATLPYDASWSNWWQRAYIQNHLHTNAAALGLAALALAG